jgi:GNAT superfamily N-acetyltransferase
MSEIESDSTPLQLITEKLTREHVLNSFHCGKPSLDNWLRRFALINQRNDSSRTYVLQRQGRVLGYYSLAAGAVRKEDSPARIAKGLAAHPISVIRLARLAVDQAHQGKGIGKLLLRDSLSRALLASEIIGARAILVHALDDQAASFYSSFGLAPSPLDPRQLMLLLKDLRAVLDRSESQG